MELTKSKDATKRLVICGILIALATILGSLSIPVLGAKVAPIQHLINVIAAVTLGPAYGISCAFVSSLLRNILGTGSILAFPGSMVGVFLAAILYKRDSCCWRSDWNWNNRCIASISIGSLCFRKGSCFICLHYSIFNKLYSWKYYCLYNIKIKYIKKFFIE